MQVFFCFSPQTLALTLCSETLKPGHSSAYRQVVQQTSGHRGSVLPNCHTGIQRRTDPDPALDPALACLLENNAIPQKA